MKTPLDFLFGTRWVAFTMVIVVAGLAACVDDDDAGDLPKASPFAFVQPPHFPEAVFNQDREPITEAGFLLGERLFEDIRLSSTGDISCGSCHSQTVAFADPQHGLSVGVNNRVGTRNAPDLTNLAFAREFMWDGGISHLDFVPINALTAVHEMDITVEEAVRRIAADESYAPMFTAAFGTDSVTGPRMSKAWSQYMRRMVSATSPYDKHVLGLEGGDLSVAAQRGMLTFEANCASCHAGELFTDGSYRNNGLDSVFRDLGRAVITERASDHGKFRVPSLRNLSRTAPYMHDARFDNLREVLEHYRSGIVASPTLDPQLRGGIPLTDQDVEDLEAFLETLTDWEFLRDPLF